MGATQQDQCSHGLRTAAEPSRRDDPRRLEQVNFVRVEPEPPQLGFFGVCCSDPTGRRLGIFLVLLLGFFFLELVYGIITGSVALLSDALHMLSDVLAIVMAIHAIVVSKRPESQQYTYGMTRASVVAGLINGVFLISVTGMMLFEVAGKFIHIDELKDIDGRGPEILWVGSAGLACNLLGLCLVGEAGHSHGPGGHSHGEDDDHDHSLEGSSGQGVGHGHGDGHGHGNPSSGHNHNNSTGTPARGHSSDSTGHAHSSGGEGHDLAPAPARKKDHGNLNVNAAFLHVMGDTLGSVIVVAVALILIYAEGEWKYFADPVLTLIILTIIAKSAVPLMYKCIAILMQGTPTDIDTQELRWALGRRVPEILNIHDLHLWELEPGRVVGSMHVVLPNDADFTKLLAIMKDVLHSRGIHSCAVQPEYHVQEGQAPSMLPWRSSGVEGERCDNNICLMPCATGCRDEQVCCQERRRKPETPQSQRYGNSLP